MNFGVSAKATVAVAGKACNEAWRRDSGLPEEPAPYLPILGGLPIRAAAAALPGWPSAPPKDGAGRLAAATRMGNASHPKVHNTL